jgi:peptide/nickel transport system permease protein
MEAALTPNGIAPGSRRVHPMRSMLLQRLGLGLVTVWIASMLVFLATEVLPGNAALAVLGHSATPQRLHALEIQLHLDRPLVAQYWSWMAGVLHGRFGTSLASGDPVGQLIGPRIANSLALIGVAAVLGILIGVSLGVIAAARRDGIFDHVSSVAALGVTALPEFVVAVALVILFAAVVLHWFPAVFTIPAGVHVWQEPRAMVLPVLTLVIVIVPYIFRMTRGAMIDALESEYVELAELKGLSGWRILRVHAFPNALPPIVQVIGLVLIYLAGGIVVVEYVFNFPGIGQGLVAAVSDRDIPTIQAIVVLLAIFYVFVNIVTDMIALGVTPRRRFPR